MEPSPDQPTGRTERKRQAVVAQATTLFLANGFRGTSMDEIAAAAGVSKQTLYKQFGGKESLFREIVEGVTQNSDLIVASLTTAFGTASAVRTLDDLETRLVEVARGYLDRILDPRVLSLRRLVIAEADRFPDLARSYYEQGPGRGIEAVAACLAPYAEVGLLMTSDLRTAAAHFCYLALAPAQDRALLMPADLPGAKDREQLARTAVAAFVAAYGAR